MGMTFRELMYEHAGGMRSDKPMKAFIPGGASAPFLTPDHLDVKLDFESVAAAGSMLGSGGVTVMEEGTSMVWAALRLMEFFYHESCGKCSPCREGSSWLVQTMRRIVAKRGRMEDLETLMDLCKNIAGRTVCAFGDAEVAPIMSTLKHWRHEYVDLIHEAEAANLIRPEPVGSERITDAAHRVRLDIATVSMTRLCLTLHKPFASRSTASTVTVPKGTLVIEAARRVGVMIPHFCYHPKLKPDANCRMCLVEIEKMPKLQTACSTPADEGMSVRTATTVVNDAHKSVLEFILANHPLDCPVCDQGGKCDLQDFSHEYTATTSRFVETKRIFQKEYFSPLIETQMNRCVQCLRCVRYCDEVMDVKALAPVGRGTMTEIKALRLSPARL